MEPSVRPRWLVPADWPIFVKVVVFAVVMVALTLAVSTVVNTSLLRAELSSTVGREFENLAGAQMRHLADILSEQLTMLRSIAMAKVTRTAVEIGNNRYDGDLAAIQAELLALDEQWRAANDYHGLIRAITHSDINFATPLLLDYRRSFPDHVEIFLTDRYGGLVSATGRTSDYYQADEEWWQAAYHDGQGAYYIGQPAFDESAGFTALSMAVPIFSERKEGQVIGIVRSTFRIDAIQQELARVNLGQTGQLQLVDSSGAVLAVARPEQAAAKLPDAWIAAQPFEAAGYRNDLADEAGEPALVGYTSISQVEIPDESESTALHALGWLLYLSQSQREAYASVAFATRAGLAAAGLFALLAMVLALFMARLMLAPAGQLMSAAREMAAGNLAVRIRWWRRDETGMLSQAFNRMAEQIEGLVNSLEQQILARTEALQQRTLELEDLSRNLETAVEQSRRRALRLEAAGRVSHAIASVLDPAQLLDQVVQLVADHLDFYHVGIFLLDPSEQYAVLRASNSVGGQRMLARGHRLRVGQQGIVGYVTDTGRPRIALDVGLDAVHFANPDLPHTRSEMALPLAARGHILGALDVQSVEAEAFGEEDVALLQALADQVAIFLDNARLFQEAQTALEAMRRMQAQYVRQGWQQFAADGAACAWEAGQTGVRPLKEGLSLDVAQVVQSGQTMTLAGNGDGSSSPSLLVPIRLQDQVLGVLGLHRDAAGQAWTEQEIALVEAVVERMVQALESARLFQVAQQRAWQEQTIGQISSRIRASADVEGILHTAAQELGRVLGVSRAIVRLGLSEQPGQEVCP
ncbi:MAG: GAF domain-containing protein [Chloroflexota bacterium]